MSRFLSARAEAEIQNSMERIRAENRRLVEAKLGMSVDEWNAAVRRAHRLGFEGDAVELFIALTDEQQKGVLAAKWRLAGVKPEDAAEMVKLDMTPIDFYRARRNLHAYGGGPD